MAVDEGVGSPSDFDRAIEEVLHVEHVAGHGAVIARDLEHAHAITGGHVDFPPEGSSHRGVDRRGSVDHVGLARVALNVRVGHRRVARSDVRLDAVGHRRLGRVRVGGSDVPAVDARRVGRRGRVGLGHGVAHRAGDGGAARVGEEGEHESEAGAVVHGGPSLSLNDRRSTTGDGTCLNVESSTHIPFYLSSEHEVLGEILAKLANFSAYDLQNT